PPEPYVAADPFEPFAIAAVELEAERMVVLGQVVRGVGPEDLRVGQAMELVLEPLSEDADTVKLTWKWKPATEASA
ncbi:MAG: benzoylsuccinyl-CoA thiolase, partial [Gammaproteobacteria bacterium]